MAVSLEDVLAELREISRKLDMLTQEISVKTDEVLRTIKMVRESLEMLKNRKNILESGGNVRIRGSVITESGGAKWISPWMYDWTVCSTPWFTIEARYLVGSDRPSGIHVKFRNGEEYYFIPSAFEEFLRFAFKKLYKEWKEAEEK